MPDTTNTTREDRFAADIEAMFGERMRGDAAFAESIYSAIYSNEWNDGDGITLMHTMRAADNLVTEISGFSFYCEGSEGPPLPEIASAMHARGWTWEAFGYDSKPASRPWWKFW